MMFPTVNTFNQIEGCISLQGKNYGSAKKQSWIKDSNWEKTNAPL